MSITLDNQKRLKELKELLNLNEKEINILSQPVQVKRAELSLANQSYPAWRIIHNRALGPGKGGIRFHPELNEDEVQSLAFWMSLKTSLLNLPYGGAKGGVKINPKELSSTDLEMISRAYIQAFHQYLGEDKDIPAPDLYTNWQVMAWMLDEYEKINNCHQPAMITGKPLELGGIEIRQEATAQGAYYIAEQVINNFLSNNQSIKIAIQGFGNAGSFLAKKLASQGHLIIALSDSQGGIYNEKGLNIEKLSNFKKEGNSLKDFSDGQAINNHELLSLKTDILALAALENQITENNVDNVQAKYILEVANGPINYLADKVLREKNILVLPDILTNAGGVVASHFEGVQNKVGQVFDNDYLISLLKKKMNFAWQEIFNLYQLKKKKISLRQAAYMIAIKRILIAEKWRGRL